MNNHKFILIIFSLMLVTYACKDDDETPILKDETPYILEYGNLPAPDLPADNPLTVQGIKLGRMLFYDEILSEGNGQACADCHKQVEGFSDTTKFSLGVAEMPGKRQAMPTFNMAWHSNQFFWDGRANLLRDQALLPIQDPLEMNETLEDMLNKLRAESMYVDQFSRTFGSQEITSEKVALAIEQFMLSIVSFDSKYDQVQSGTATFTASEERGRKLYFEEYNPFFPEDSGADCAHCHGGLNFENDEYMNNGLDTDANFVDLGREDVTELAIDRAKFKVPTLRNIELTAPYMHDGRFQTLEEVVDHYNSGIQSSSTTDPTVLNTMATGLLLTEQDKTDLVNFLKTLTDPSLATNEAYKSPF